MKLLIVGSNPSNSSKNDSPFDSSTKSGRTLSHWISTARHWSTVMLVNVSNSKTPKNRPLSIKEIKENLPTLESRIKVYEPDRIIAIGKTASKALTLLHFPFFEMYHPSGLNRQLNDKKALDKKLEELRDYLK